MSEDEKAHDRIGRSSFLTDQLAKIIVAFDSGDIKEVIRLYDEALEQRFEDGIAYAKDTVSDWHRP